ncbi:hypothetical protein LSCM1_06811 [Leishmania martiniquensis]|uniref:Uncharacterized protein n=1 Tax=Leishmania martiniquensis TaxID=1580590 RepID=A0A836KQ77_9TRYP|nr:hypothetical protein LSCM1_06811 [Leishmania martiniquensis]
MFNHLKVLCSSRRLLANRRLSIQAAALQGLQRMRLELVRLCGSERDVVLIKRFLCSWLLLLLFLAVTSAAVAFWLRKVPYCHFTIYPVEPARQATLGRIEPLPQHNSSERRDRNVNLERSVNEYLAQHNGTDGVQLLPVRIHFIVVSTHTNWMFCMAAASCALADIRPSFLGVDTPYSHVLRYEKYLDYLERERLRDEDVVVTLDTDVSWTGSDVVPFLRKFARYSPASEAALDLAAVRAWEDYGEDAGSTFMAKLRAEQKQPSRPLLQLPPVIFNSDDDCYFHELAEDLFQCFSADYIMTHLIAAARNGASFFSPKDAARASREKREYFEKIYNSFFARGHGHRLLNTSLEAATYLRIPGDPFFYDGAFSVGRNPAQYLNAGMHISRVWALRELGAGVLRFARKQPRRSPKKWSCDQSIIGIMRYYLRMFEINKGLLFQTGHNDDGELFRDPFGLPVGLLSIDRHTEFMFTSHLRRRKGLGNLTSYYVRNRKNDPIPDADLIETTSGALMTAPLWGREVQPRCLEVPLPDSSVSVWCSPITPKFLLPSFLHFAAGSKHLLYRKYRECFAWYFAARRNGKALSSSMKVLSTLEVELWYQEGVHHIPFFSVCPSPFH